MRGYQPQFCACRSNWAIRAAALPIASVTMVTRPRGGIKLALDYLIGIVIVVTVVMRMATDHRWSLAPAVVSQAAAAVRDA